MIAQSIHEHFEDKHVTYVLPLSSFDYNEINRYLFILFAS